MDKKILIISLSILILIVFGFLFFNGKFRVPNIPLALNDSASQYCIDNGGAIQAKQRGDGKEYKICFFEDNRQCEADSLLKGDCPVGGLKVTGYITEAAVYCAILGGDYEIAGMDDSVENGNCSFFNGNVCNVWDLYNGKCEKGAINSIVYQNDEFNFSLNLPSDWNGKYEVRRKNGENGVRYVYLDYGEANFFGISITPYSFWEKQEKKEGEYLGRNNEDVFAFIYSSDPLRSDKQWGDEYLKMLSRVKNIKETFKITKPYIFLEKRNEAGRNYTIDIMYPYVGAISNGQVNIEINNFVEEIVSSFKEGVGKDDSWDGNNTLKVFYDPYEINNDFISIRFEISEYNGGAHPVSRSKSFNYDLKKDKIINLSDILDPQKDYLDSISSKTIQYLLEINKKDGFSDEEWIKDGAGPKEDNFKIFTFNKKTIVFHFDPYVIAAYAAGRQEVVFPLGSIKDILKKEAIADYGLKFD